MWYVKHSFDGIVMRGFCCQGWRGAPALPGPPARLPGSGAGSSRTQPFFLLWQSASFLQQHWCQGRGMWKTEHTGGPCSPKLNSPWAGFQTTCHTQGLMEIGQEGGAGSKKGKEAHREQGERENQLQAAEGRFNGNTYGLTQSYPNFVNGNFSL